MSTLLLKKMRRWIKLSTSFIEDDNLVNQLRECLVGCAMVDNSVRPSLLSLRNSFIRNWMMQRMTSFRYSLQSYDVHWTLDALEDNIGPISDIIALTKRMPSNLESLSGVNLSFAPQMLAPTVTSSSTQSRESITRNSKE